MDDNKNKELMALMVREYTLNRSGITETHGMFKALDHILEDAYMQLTTEELTKLVSSRCV